MTLAVMTRASLGHTGHKLAASAGTQLIYLCAVVGALARIGAAVMPAWSMPLLHLSVVAWSAAFLGFAIVYGPLLLRRKQPAGETAAV